MYSLGYDLGSSFVKAALVNTEEGTVVASASYPEREMPIISAEPGWAEQDPAVWWEAVKKVTAALASRSPVPLRNAAAVGVSYQMHGLVLVDKNGIPLRPSIIWCDSRAGDIGRKAFAAMGERLCLSEMLNSPGNFTASKLCWVKNNEPALYEKAFKALLPGDFLALRMTGEYATTVSGLSEGMFWNFRSNDLAMALLSYYGIRDDLVARIVPSMGLQGSITAGAARELGLQAGTPVTYRAGDQPNNAFSLRVLEAGEIAATAGTSGVVYAVSNTLTSDPQSRINSFAHVNHSAAAPRVGILLCINGTGISNSWIRKMAGDGALTYEMMNREAALVPVGSRGLSVLPFGNGTERIFRDRMIGASLAGLNFNLHGKGELFRGVQEGVAFAFAYGIDMMRSLGIATDVLRAGGGNMFLSPIFRSTLASVAGVKIELFNTDGAQGAARGAAAGAGEKIRDVFKGLDIVVSTQPEPERDLYLSAYDKWWRHLESRLAQAD